MGKRVYDFIVNVFAWIFLISVMICFMLLCAAAKHGIEELLK